MSLRRRLAVSRRALPLVLAAVIAAGCQGKLPAAPGLATADGEGRVSTDAFGNVSIAVGGKAFRLSTADGKPIGDITIQAGSKFYTLHDGRFAMPADALRDAKENSRAFFRVFVTGYVPRQVWIGQSDESIVVSPQHVLAVKYAMPPTGGQLKADDGSVGVSIGAGMLTKPQTKVALSSYTPPVTEQTQKDFQASRNDFLAKVKKGGANAYALTQASGGATCEDADNPLPCPPIAESTGIMLTIDGPLHAGTMTATLDLNALTRGWDGQGQPPWVREPGQWTDEQIRHGKAAAKMQKTFRQIKHHPHAGDFESVLANEYGVRLVGDVLYFDVHVGVDDTIDGYVRTDIEGVSLLGVALEFTAVSSLNQTLPPAAVPPLLLPPGSVLPGPGTTAVVGPLGQDATSQLGLAANLVGQDGASLVGLDGSTLIGLDSATLIGNDSAGLVNLDASNLVGQDAASLVGMDGSTLVGMDGSTLVNNTGGALAGHAELPFTDRPKYQLATYQEVPYPNAGQARAITFDGTPLSAWVPIDALGNFYIYKLPPSPQYFTVEVQVGSYHMTATSIAPANKLVSVKVNAASTVVTAVVNSQPTGLLALLLRLLSIGGYNRDVKAVFLAMNQQQAQAAVSGTGGTAPALAVSTALRGGGTPITGYGGLLPAPPMATGQVISWAGTGPAGDADGQRGGGDTFNTPQAIDAKGNGNAVFVADGNRVREINPGGTRTTVGPVVSAPADWGAYAWTTPVFSDIQSVQNDLYVSDSANNAIFKIDSNATITTVLHATGDIGGFHRETDGTIFAVMPGYDQLWKYPPVGAPVLLYGSPGDHTLLNYPSDVEPVDATHLLIADTSNHRIVSWDLSTSTATTVLGTGPGAPYNFPTDVTVSADGYAYVANRDGYDIRRFSLTAPVDEHVAGGSASYADGPLASAQFRSPVSLDADGTDIYIVDAQNHRIRRLRP